MNENKSYTVKEWFANKVADEVKRNINMCDVFAVIKETEKAVYAILSIGADRSKATWIPKSALVESEIGYNADGSFNHETFIWNGIEYDEAIAAFHSHWASYI